MRTCPCKKTRHNIANTPHTHCDNESATAPYCSICAITLYSSNGIKKHVPRGHTRPPWHHTRVLVKNCFVLWLSWLIFVPVLTCGHKLWVVTERTRYVIHVSEMSFLYKVAVLPVLDTVRSSVIQERLGVESLLLQTGGFGLCSERLLVPSLMRCFGHVQPGPEANLGYAGGIIFLSWPGDTPRRSWRR